AAEGHREVVDQHPMIADTALRIADDAVEDAAHVDELDLEPTLLADLAAHRLARRLAELDEPTGNAPLAGQRRAAALDEQEAVADRLLQRGDARGRIGRGREERRDARRIDAEHDGAVLEKGLAVTPLGAADDLPAVDLELVGAGTREAERGHRAVLAPALHDL